MVSKLMIHKHFRSRIDERLGTSRSFAGLNNVCVDANGWLCALVNKSHISRYEWEPMSMAEALRHLGTLGKLVAISTKYASVQASCYMRSAKVTRTSDSNTQSSTGEFVVRAKLVPRKLRKSKALTVTARLEGMKGELIYIVVFEYELIKEPDNSYLADTYLINSDQLFISHRSLVSDGLSVFRYDNESISHVRLSNTTGEADLRLRLDGVQENCIHTLRCYPVPFIVAGLSTLASRMAAGRRGKRHYHYAVKYAEIKNEVLNSFHDVLKLECIHLEQAHDVDVIQCHAMFDGKPIVQAELGIRISD